MPFNPGIAMSRTSRSGASRAAFATAESPSFTVATTSNSPDSNPTRLSSIARWSSATSTRGRLVMSCSPDSGGARPESCDHALLYGELHQLGAGLQAQLLHHPVLMEGNRPRGYVEDGTNLLHRSPFRQ